MGSKILTIVSVIKATKHSIVKENEKNANLTYCVDIFIQNST